MFNQEYSVKADAENKAGAIALLLTSRKGGWFTFESGSGSSKESAAIHTALLVSYSESKICTVDGKVYFINKETYHKLLAVMKKIEGMAEDIPEKILSLSAY